MKFHIFMPGCVHTPPLTQPWELSLTGPDVVRVAQAADELGFESLLIPEHFVVGTHHADTTGTHFLDATTAQAVMAGATTRIKLGSMLTLLPLHNPVVMAKAICTLDWLSGGRAAMTVGLGWQEDEYHTLGVPWSGRGSRMDDYLSAMLELWHSDSLNWIANISRSGTSCLNPSRYKGRTPRFGLAAMSTRRCDGLRALVTDGRPGSHRLQTSPRSWTASDHVLSSMAVRSRCFSPSRR